MRSARPASASSRDGIFNVRAAMVE
jgi:hypothetical protein